MPDTYKVSVNRVKERKGMGVFIRYFKIISFLLSSALLLVLSVSCTSVIAQYPGFRITDPKLKRVVIPFELHSNLIVVPVKINDGEDLKFILDTGVRTAILTNKVYVDGLPSKHDRMISLMGAGNAGQIDAYVSNNISFDLPGITADGNALLVLNEDYLMLENFLGTRVHGILGYEIFSRFVVEIDYLNQKITLHKPEHFKPRRSYTPVPITIEDTKPYINDVKFKVEDSDSTYIKIRLMVDTGASHSLLLNTASNEHIQVPEKNLYSYLGRGLSGDIYGYLGRVPDLTIDKYHIKGIIASFPETSGLSEALAARTNTNGNIGGAILKRFRVVFDYASEVMYLKKNRLFRKPFEYNMSGIELIAIGPLLETYVVSKVAKDTPADRAGIKEGDIVLSVNGMAFPELTLATFSNLVHSRPNKRVKIRLLRNGQILKKKFRLERVL